MLTKIILFYLSKVFDKYSKSLYIISELINHKHRYTTMTNQADTYTTEIFETFKNEYMNELMELIEQDSFREMAIDIAKKMGIQATMWNTDTEFRMAFYAMLAGKQIQMQKALSQGQEQYDEFVENFSF